MSTDIPEPFVKPAPEPDPTPTPSTSSPTLPADGWDQQPVGHVDILIGDVTLRLFCWAHNAVHTLTAEQVERAVYALGGMAVDMRSEKIAHAGTPSAHVADYLAPPDCLYEVLGSARLRSAGYRELVEQGCQGRAESGEHVCPAGCAAPDPCSTCGRPVDL